MEKNIISFDRDLANKVGINSAIVLHKLIDVQSHLVDMGELPLDSFFQCTTECLEELTTMKYKSQTNAIKILIENGFIKLVRREGNVKYFQIQFDRISEFYNHNNQDKETMMENNDSEIQRKHPLLLAKKYIKKNFPKVKTLDITEFPNEQFSKEEDVINNSFIDNNIYINNNKYINNTNKTSSLKTNITSMSNTREMPEGGNAEKEIVDNSKYMKILTEFLKDIGFSVQMISFTVKEFIKKGINKFAVRDLKSAYDRMVSYEKNVRKVMYPPTFFANGVSLAIPEPQEQQKPQEPKKAVTSQPSESLPFYNWLEDEGDSYIPCDDNLFPYLQ